MTLLSQINLETKEVWVPVDSLPGFEVKLAYCGRKVSEALRKKATEVTFKNGQTVTKFNDELFLKLFVEHTVRGWKGLTYSILDKIMLVDLSSIEDWETELTYSPEGAHLLISQSSFFDNWVSQAAFELDNFRNSKQGKPAQEV